MGFHSRQPRPTCIRSATGKHTLAWLTLAIAFALSVTQTQGAIYEFDLDLTDSTTYIYSEGPMFVKGDTPLGSEDSKISLDLEVKTAEGAPVADNININIIYFDEGSTAAVGYGTDAEDGNIITRSDLCCTDDLVLAGLCTNVGQVWFPSSVKSPPQTFNFKMPKSTNTNTNGKDKGKGNNFANDKGGVGAPTGLGQFQSEKVVTQKGEQYVAVVACGVTQQINIAGQITFKNPYGYLSGESFGFLPMYGAIMVAYTILLLLFIYSSVRHCDRLLHIQNMITGILALSVLTSAVWFGMYLDLDTTGKAVCCPLHVGATIAVFLDVCKRSFSRCLLLAV